VFPLSNSSIFSFSLRSSISCWHHFRLLFFPSVMWSRRQFLHKMWPIQLAFLHFILVRMFFCLDSCVILLHFLRDWLNWSSSFSSAVQSYAAIVAFC
jgi:hypothetical protein